MNAAVSDFGMSRIVQSGKSAITQSLVGPVLYFFFSFFFLKNNI